VSAAEPAQSQLVPMLQMTGLQLVNCREAPTARYDALLEVTEALGSWRFQLIPRGGEDNIYSADARNLQAGVKDFTKALKKAAGH
jgi:hypothetical protein